MKSATNKVTSVTSFAASAFASSKVATTSAGRYTPTQKYERYLPRVISQLATRACALLCVKETSPQTINRWTIVPATAIQTSGVTSANRCNTPIGELNNPANGTRTVAPRTNACTAKC